jgi:hypothetical protein
MGSRQRVRSKGPVSRVVLDRHNRHDMGYEWQTFAGELRAREAATWRQKPEPLDEEL